MRVGNSESFQPGERGEARKSCVADPRAGQIEVPQVGEAGQLCRAGVGDAGAGQIKLVQLAQQLAMPHEFEDRRIVNRWASERDRVDRLEDLGKVLANLAGQPIELSHSHAPPQLLNPRDQLLLRRIAFDGVGQPIAPAGLILSVFLGAGVGSLQFEKILLAAATIWVACFTFSR